MLGALWYAASQISAAEDLARSQRREEVRDQLDQVWFVEVDVAFRHVRVLGRRLAKKRSSEELAEAASEADRMLTNALAQDTSAHHQARGAHDGVDQLIKATRRLEPEAAVPIGEVDVIALRRAVDEVVLDLLEVVPLSELRPSDQFWFARCPPGSRRPTAATGPTVLSTVASERPSVGRSGSVR